VFAEAILPDADLLIHGYYTIATDRFTLWEDEMKKLLLAALSLVIAGSASVGAARADDGKEMMTNTAMLPVRTLAVGTAFVVGTPIAVFKRCAFRSINYTNTFADNIGGHDNLPPVLFASVMGVPFGMIAGGAEGVMLGGKNALTGVEKPFSKESFSMGDIDGD
jgi:hypothetical protein